MEIKAVAGDIAKIRAGAIIVNHFEGAKRPEGEAAAVDKAIDGAISRLVKQGDIKGKLNEVTVLHGPGKLPAGRVVVTGLGKKKELTTNKIRGAVAETLRYLRQKNVTSAATIVQGGGVNGIKTEEAVQALTEGAVLGLYTFRRHMTKKENNNVEIKELRIVGREGAAMQRAIDSGQVLGEAVNWARDLVNEPSNFMTPSDMAAAARKLAGEYGLKVEVLEKKQMAELGMGGILGVAQGSQQPPRFIILRYKGSGASGLDIALVGKGITFDSGGIDIKPSEGMQEMKGDMAGGASVMATLIALARLKPKINVTALVPATENMPSGTAMKPGDIITAMNGKTIEVLNTDAEGRLILADALSYAKKLGAKAIIDVATLTGACRVALGEICTGAFTNDQALLDKVMAATRETGELTWQLPMFDEYREQLKSDIADIKNIGGRYGGAITAAKFLADFIDGTPWVHLDIAGTSETDKEKGYQVKGATGVPVRTLVNVILSMAKK
ncbi:MAG: leucyl aminopeptidase [Chloroflexi bacterium RBG_16_56_11]|nr:MAG: leucyl aminopeptidase [Chloroflexi bacterium RBG_16_56_11]